MDGSGTATVTFSNVQGGFDGIGNIVVDPCFIQMGYWHEDGFWVEGNYHLLQTSPCIDTGDPNDINWKKELWPHGKHINMGVYGGTPQASMSFLTVGNKADLNNNGVGKNNPIIPMLQ